jgi:hypothetical protein
LEQTTEQQLDAITTPAALMAITEPTGSDAPATRQTPQIGDEAWYFEDQAPLLAKVAHVWSDTCVNLELESGALRSSVLVRDPDIDADNMAGSNYCVLMDLNDRDEQPPLACLACELTRLEQARALPELEAGSVTHPIAFVPGAIESFKGEDSRTMRVVALAGSLWQQAVR